MTIAALLTAAKTAVVTAIKSVGSAIAAANAISLLKAGVFVGAAAFTAYVLISSMKKRHDAVKRQSNMSPVDRALALNLGDRRNRHALDPLMKEIDLQFMGKKPGKAGKKYKKNASRDGLAAIREIQMNLAKKVPEFYDERGKYRDRKMLQDLEQFKLDCDEETRRDRAKDTDIDPFALRKLWTNPEIR